MIKTGYWQQMSFSPKVYSHGTKVDWSSRDLKYVRHLIQLQNALIWDLDSPRHSTKWWIKQISQVSTIEKTWIYSITTLFLRKYSEAILVHIKSDV